MRAFLKCCVARLHCIVLVVLVAGCSKHDMRHRLIVSIPEQRMLVMEDGKPLVQYQVSTSMFCVSNEFGSNGTPLGEFEIIKKIGDDAPFGAVFEKQRMTGEILRPNTPGRFSMVSRLLCLNGLETSNRNTFKRTIYIHGTAEEANIGKQASHGCIRMRSTDVMKLYDIVGLRTKVLITEDTLEQIAHVNIPDGRPAAANGGLGAPNQTNLLQVATGSQMR